MVANEIIRLKKLCTHVVTVFCNEALNENWKENELRLISLQIYSSSAITETESGRLTEHECLSSRSAYQNRGAH